MKPHDTKNTTKQAQTCKGRTKEVNESVSV